MLGELHRRQLLTSQGGFSTQSPLTKEYPDAQLSQIVVNVVLFNCLTTQVLQFGLHAKHCLGVVKKFKDKPL